jgi:hypothetical protein
VMSHRVVMYLTQQDHVVLPHLRGKLHMAGYNRAQFEPRRFQGDLSAGTGWRAGASALGTSLQESTHRLACTSAGKVSSLYLMTLTFSNLTGCPDAPSYTQYELPSGYDAAAGGGDLGT